MTESVSDADLNPYAAPATALAAGDSARPRFFRVRLIPASFCWCVAGLAFVSFALHTVVMGYMEWLAFRHGPFPEWHTVAKHRALALNVAGSLLCLGDAACGHFAARAWMKGRWWLAVPLTASLYALTPLAGRVGVSLTASLYALTSLAGRVGVSGP